MHAWWGLDCDLQPNWKSLRLEFQLGCFPWKARVLNESTTLKTSAYIGTSILDLSRHFGMIAITITSGINTTIKISYLHKTSTEDLVVTKDVSCEVKQDNFSQTFAEHIPYDNERKTFSDTKQFKSGRTSLHWPSWSYWGHVLKLTLFIHKQGLSLSSYIFPCPSLLHIYCIGIAEKCQLLDCQHPLMISCSESLWSLESNGIKDDFWSILHTLEFVCIFLFHVRHHKIYNFAAVKINEAVGKRIWNASKIRYVVHDE